MAKAKPGNVPARRDVTSYAIRGTDKVVRVGDCVIMRPAVKNSLPYVASVLKMEADRRNCVKVHVRWYYRPEESFGGRREFHGAKELFLSDHYDIQNAHTIEGKCTVHSFESYTQLENVQNEDYYCRFEYRPLTRQLLPKFVAVYCTCEQPYNPDTMMIQCEECEEWYHPPCVGLTMEQVKLLDCFVCPEHNPVEKKPIITPPGDDYAESKPYTKM